MAQEQDGASLKRSKSAELRVLRRFRDELGILLRQSLIGLDSPSDEYDDVADAAYREIVRGGSVESALRAAQNRLISTREQVLSARDMSAVSDLLSRWLERPDGRSARIRTHRL